MAPLTIASFPLISWCCIARSPARPRSGDFVHDVVDADRGRLGTRVEAHAASRASRAGQELGRVIAMAVQRLAEAEGLRRARDHAEAASLALVRLDRDGPAPLRHSPSPVMIGLFGPPAGAHARGPAAPVRHSSASDMPPVKHPGRSENVVSPRPAGRRIVAAAARRAAYR